MTGRDSVCPSASGCRRFYPDERYTPPTGDCGRFQAGASPASTWSCPRAHNRGLRAPGSPHRSDGRRPKPPGARDVPIRTAASEPPPPVPGRPTSFLSFRTGPAKLGPVSTSARRALLLGVPALLFALITWQVLAHGPLLGLDARLSRALVHPDRTSELLSDLGNVQVALPVLVLALAHSAWHGRATRMAGWWLPPAAAAVLMALVPAIVVPLKDWTARPGTPVVPPAVGYFPSGHTATAAIAYGSATLLLLHRLRSPAARRALVGVFAALMLGVSYGLVRRGWHWPLDVVASWCLCTVLLTALSLVLGRGVSRNTRRSSSGTPSSRTGPSSPTRSSDPAEPATSRASDTSRSSSSSSGSPGSW